MISQLSKSNIAFLVCAAVLTLTGFAMFKPDDTTALYWINLFFLLFLEVLATFQLQVVRELATTGKKPFSSQFSIFLGVHTITYISLSVCWIIVYFLSATELGREILQTRFFLARLLDRFPEASLRIYIFGILILTVCWILVSIVAGKHDVAYQEQQTKFVNQTEELRKYVAVLERAAKQKSTKENELEWQRLIREVSTTAPKDFADRKPEFDILFNNLNN